MGAVYISEAFFQSTLFQEQIEEIRCGKRTQLKVHALVSVYFIDLRNAQTTQGAIEEIKSGRAIYAKRQENGKLHLYVTKEVAEEIRQGKIELEYASIEVVSLEFFENLVKQLSSKKTKERAKETVVAKDTILAEIKKSEVKASSSRKKQDEFVKAIVKEATKREPDELDLLQAEEEHRILERKRKKEEEARQAEADRLLVFVKKEEIKRDSLRQEARIRELAH